MKMSSESSGGACRLLHGAAVRGPAFGSAVPGVDEIVARVVEALGASAEAAVSA